MSSQLFFCTENYILNPVGSRLPAKLFRKSPSVAIAINFTQKLHSSLQ
jgi:hypothetical protein